MRKVLYLSVRKWKVCWWAELWCDLVSPGVITLRWGEVAAEKVQSSSPATLVENDEQERIDERVNKSYVQRHLQQHHESVLIMCDTSSSLSWSAYLTWCYQTKLNFLHLFERLSINLHQKLLFMGLKIMDYKICLRKYFLTSWAQDFLASTQSQSQLTRVTKKSGPQKMR